MFFAAPMPSRINGKALIWNLFDDAIPNAGMKTGGVSKQNRRTVARSLPNGKMVNPK